MSNYWTESEIGLLKELYIEQGKDVKEIHEFLPTRSLQSIQVKLWTTGLSNSKIPRAYELHPSFLKGYLRGALGLKVKGRQNRGPRRELEFTITDEDILSLYKKQDGKCYLSGEEISLPKTAFQYQRCEYTASIDRIDSNKGYVVENIALCHKRVNIMKGMLTNEEFIRWARNIAEKSI
jgi:hypothetical protein